MSVHICSHVLARPRPVSARARSLSLPFPFSHALSASHSHSHSHSHVCVCTNMHVCIRTQVIKGFYQPLKKGLKQLEAHHAGWKDRYDACEKQRRALHNQVLELKGNIRVFCRVRPQLKHESGPGTENAIFFRDERPDLEENEQIAVMDDSKGSEKVFDFDHCFGPRSTQEEVYASFGSN